MTLRELLKSYELEDSQIEEVMKSHGIAVQKEQEKAAKEREEKNAALKELEEVKTKIEELEKSKSDSAKMSAEIAEKDGKIAALMEDLKKSTLTIEITKALNEAGALDYDSVSKLINMEQIELSEDGSVNGIDKEIKRLKTGEYTGLLFKSDKPQHKDTYPVQTSHGEAKVNTDSFGKQAAKEAKERKAAEQNRSAFFEF